MIIGTDKKGGIAVYDLTGRQLQYRADGRMNNVDLRCGFRLRRSTITLVAAGDRRGNDIVVYRVDERARKLAAVPAGPLEPELDVYGLCMYRSARTGAHYVFVTSEEGNVEQWRLFADGRGRVAGSRVRRFDVGGRTEGCAADDELGQLYLAEEEKGIWRYGAEPEAGGLRTLVDEAGTGHLVADVEGLTILYGAGNRGYLVASSQGDSSFAVYARGGDNAYIGRFRVTGARGVDGAEDTDGVDGVTTSLGPRFPGGVLVVQDGENGKENQNFKVVALPRHG